MTDETMETLYRERKDWLRAVSAKEADVVQDSDGEFVYMQDEIGTAGEDGYSFSKYKVRLPKSLELANIFDGQNLRSQRD